MPSALDKYLAKQRVDEKKVYGSTREPKRGEEPMLQTLEEKPLKEQSDIESIKQHPEARDRQRDEEYKLLKKSNTKAKASVLTNAVSKKSDAERMNEAYQKSILEKLRAK